MAVQVIQSVGSKTESMSRLGHTFDHRHLDPEKVDVLTPQDEGRLKDDLYRYVGAERDKLLRHVEAELGMKADKAAVESIGKMLEDKGWVLGVLRSLADDHIARVDKETGKRLGEAREYQAGAQAAAARSEAARDKAAEEAKAAQEAAKAAGAAKGDAVAAREMARRAQESAECLAKQAGEAATQASTARSEAQGHCKAAEAARKETEQLQRRAEQALSACAEATTAAMESAKQTEKWLSEAKGVLGTIDGDAKKLRADAAQSEAEQQKLRSDLEQKLDEAKARLARMERLLPTEGVGFWARLKWLCCGPVPAAAATGQADA